MNTPQFTIITSCYQQVDYIRQAIESVLLQRYPNVQHIIVDRGSTDGSIEIIRSYPHLQLISLPGVTTAHALSHAYGHASGDIVAFLDADAWYAPGIFKDVALALEEYPIVIGACEVCDRYGVRQHVVTNSERTWHDLLKYWISFSTPSLPSVFVRRTLLERSKFQGAQLIDTSFDSRYDLDLWLRVSEHTPMARRLPRVLSYLREIERPTLAEQHALGAHEVRRIFARHTKRHIYAETRMSVIVPVHEDAPYQNGALTRTLQSLQGVAPNSVELIMLDYGKESATAKQRRRQTLELARQYKGHVLRYVRAELGSYDGLDIETHVFEAINQSLLSLHAPLVTVMQAGDALSTGWVEQCEREFEADNCAFALLYSQDQRERELFLQPGSHSQSFRPESIFVAPRLLPNFVARTIALDELKGFSPHQGTTRVAPLYALRQLLLRLLHKGWAIAGAHNLSLPQSTTPLSAYQAAMQTFQVYVNAYLVQNLQQEFEQEPFARVRAAQGAGIALPPALVTSAQTLMARTPPDWPFVIEDRNNREALLAWTQRAPEFLPTWQFLHELADKSGDQSLLVRAREGKVAAERVLSQM